MSRALLNIPELARDVLRQYAAERVEAGLPVAWLSVTGDRWYAKPDPGKGPDAWRVTTARWEFCYPRAFILTALAESRAVEVMP